MRQLDTERGRTKISETIDRTERAKPPVYRRPPEKPQLGTPGTDFGTWIVPRTTIPAASRVIAAGSDTFTPGQGTAYLFKIDASGDLTPWLDSAGQVIWRTVYNASDEDLHPNSPAEAEVLSLAGPAMTTMAGLAFTALRPVSTTDYIGPDTPVVFAVMDRAGKLCIPGFTVGTIATSRLERAIVSGGAISPDGAGGILLFLDQQLDDVAQGGTADTIQLATGASGIGGTYTGWMVTIVNGTCAGQTRRIWQYDGGASRVAQIGAVNPGVTVRIPHSWRGTPDTTSEYKLYKPVPAQAIWSHADSVRTLVNGEEVYVQQLAGSPYYEVIRGTDRSLLRGTVSQFGGIAEFASGQVVANESSRFVIANWTWMTAGMDLEFAASVAIAWAGVDLSGSTQIGEGYIYQIWGADCEDLI